MRHILENVPDDESELAYFEKQVLIIFIHLLLSYVVNVLF